MKAWKTEIVSSIIEKAQTDRIISLYEVAVKMGYNHIHQQDCLDICNTVLKALPNYRVVKLCTEKQLKNKATAGLFTAGTFIDAAVEFEEEPDRMGDFLEDMG